MQKQFIKYFRTLFSILFLFFAVTITYAQAEIPAKPKAETSVYDGAKLLSGYEEKALEQKLINYADSTSTQIVVATVYTVKGENISMYATEWAHKWGIGQKGKDNGIIILVAKDDRKLTIQTGYGVEHLLTDALSRRIIANIITPEFKKGNFYGGLDRATSAIMQIMSGEYKGSPKNNSEGGGIPVIFIIIFFIILISILSNRNRGNRGGGRRNYKNDDARSILEAIILSNAGRGGFGGGGGFGGSSGGGSFGGGGFSGGFGGGGFGGGGASGGW